MNYSPIIFDNYSFQSKNMLWISYLSISFIWGEFSIWKSFTSRLHVQCLTDHLNTWVNIYVDVIHDVTVMLMFIMLIARIYNCQWHERI